MKLTKLSKIAASLVLVGAAAQAVAGPVYINRGASIFGDGKTGEITQLGLTGSLATSIYEPVVPGGPIGPGAKIYDTNIKSILNSFGVIGDTTAASINGTPGVNIKDTPSSGQRNIDALNSLDPLTDDTEGFNTPGGWGMSFNYYFTGGISAGGTPYFNGGYFDLFYVSGDANNGKQLLHMNVKNSDIAISNLDVLGTFTFDFNGDGDITDANETADPFVAGFWNDILSGKTFAEIEGDSGVLSWSLDTNVDPPIPTPSQLRAFVGADGKTRYVRQTKLDSSIDFEVPEPGTLSLLGLSMLGLAAGARRKMK